ncbi:unnamed protein product, partial [marine sediment metagenome]
MVARKLLLATVLVACVPWGRPSAATAAPQFAPPEIIFSGKAAGPPSSSVCGFAVVARGDGPQLAVMKRPPSFVAAVRGNEHVSVSFPCQRAAGRLSVTVEVCLTFGGEADAELSIGDRRVQERLRPGRSVKLKVDYEAGEASLVIRATTRARGQEAGVRWRGLRVETSGGRFDVPAWPTEARP